MNRNDYLTDTIVSRMNDIRNSANVRDDRISRGRDEYAGYLASRDMDIETDDRYADARNDYLATCLASDSERACEMFRDNEDLREVNLDYYLGKHDRVRSVVSRDYEDEDGETVHSHLLVEHTHDNPHLEGVKRLAAAYARVTFVDQND